MTTKASSCVGNLANCVRISDVRWTFVGCKPSNGVRIVIYSRINICTFEKLVQITEWQIEMYLDSSRKKNSEIYITGNRNVFCHIFSLSFFRYLLLYLRSKLYRQNFIRVLKGLSTTHTESLLRRTMLWDQQGEVEVQIQPQQLRCTRMVPLLLWLKIVVRSRFRFISGSSFPPSEARDL